MEVEVEKFEDFIIKLGVYVPFKVTPLNYYIVKVNSKDWILIDTGYKEPYCETLLYRVMGEEGLSFDNLKAILITHDHADHCGQVYSIMEEAKGVTVIIGEEDLKHTVEYFGREELDLWKAHHFSNHRAPKEFIERVVRSFHFFRKRKEWLRGGDPRIESVATNLEREFGGVNIKVVPTPGHTLGHLSFFLEEKRVYFSGDSILKGFLSQISLRPGWQQFDQWEMYRESLLKVATLNPKIIFPGHGDIIDTPLEVIKELLREMEVREELLVKVVKENGPITTFDIAQRFAVKKDKLHFDIWIVWGEVIAIASHLEKKGIIYSKIDGNNIFYYC